jgi:hypothetical protein
VLQLAAERKKHVVSETCQGRTIVQKRYKQEDMWGILRTGKQKFFWLLFCIMGFEGSGHEVVTEKIKSKIFVWNSVGKDHACMHTYIHAYIHKCVHTYIHACMRTCIHTHTHTHTHKHSR